MVAHFGASFVDKALLGCAVISHLDEALKDLRLRMEKEVEHDEADAKEYFEKIDAEYKTIGRPKSVFNWREIEYLCSINCSIQEIAGFFQVSKDTIMRRIKEEYGINWAEYYERNSQGTRVALRRRQVQAAMEGSDAMLKFLGKNLLGQKEKIDFEGEVKVNSWVDLMNNLDDEAKPVDESE